MALLVVGAFASTAAAAVLLPCIMRRLPPHRLSISALHRGRAMSPAATALGRGESDSFSQVRGEYLEDVAQAASLLAAGELVAFPTETVYGLGANARNATALARIFEVKGRPRTDPLIVHVSSATDAESLFAMQSPDSRRLFLALTTDFWPGPLTIVAPMAPDLPSLLSAGTGAVGVRCPSHVRARQLIAASGVPIAAPSANRFGHVSPTKPEHVMSDLGESRVFVLRDEPGASCEIGIESTVLKIDEENRQLVLLRRGGVSETKLSRWVQAHSPDYALVIGVPSSNPAMAASKAKVAIATETDQTAVGKVATEACSTSGAPQHAAAGKARSFFGSSQQTPAGEVVSDGDGEVVKGMAAPGMLLTHYAPDLPSFLLRLSSSGTSLESTSYSQGAGHTTSPHQISNAVVLDFGGRASALAPRAAAYRDLSPDGDAASAASKLFEALRWAEECQQDRAKCVLLPDVLSAIAEACGDNQLGNAGSRSSSHAEAKAEAAPALADRLFRAASGRSAVLGSNGEIIPTEVA
mmetsp:Transcript_14172/g.43427  ORF Transcript_14172/g.43427 Transcript_14172/m.43427 type:complete len:525 (-) Transcript_14172:680-2254(-)